MNSKWFSRKFLVFFLWSLLTSIAVFTKLETLELSIGNIIQYYFFISVSYMGTNAIGKAIDNGLIKKS